MRLDPANPLLAFDLTPGEMAMFAKVAKEEEIHNALANKLSLYRDGIVEQRNRFVEELCRKYGIARSDRNKVTFDPVTGRLVSIFATSLGGHTIKVSPPEFEKAAARLTLASIRELGAIHAATEEARRG